MFKKVHNINNARKLIPAKKSWNGQTAKINTREMQFFSKKKKPRKLEPSKISTIKVMHSYVITRNIGLIVVHLNLNLLYTEDM